MVKQVVSKEKLMDISLCNVIGLNGDYLYVPSLNKLYVLMEPLGMPAMVFIGLLVVYLMVVMGNNLQNALSLVPQGPGPGQWAVLCMLLLLMLSYLSTTSSNGLSAHIYVTKQDLTAAIALFGYVVYYCLRIEYRVWKGDGVRANPVNPMLGSITAAVLRVYGSMENPYSAILFVLMLTWLFHKISMACSHLDPWRTVDVLVDAVLLSVLLACGAVSYEDVQGTAAACTLLQGLFAAMVVNKGINSVILH